MHILITGVPGSGKSSLAERLAERINFKLLNELEFCRKKKIGRMEGKELIVPLKNFERELKKELKKEGNLVVEGHLCCEIKIPVEKIFLIKAEPKTIEKRLRRRGYKEEKIQENVFCERIGYCLKELRKRYPAKLIRIVKNDRKINNTLEKIIKELRKDSRGINK